MTQTSSARAVVERFLEVSAAGAYDQLADLYAEDAVIEMPYAPPGMPRSSQGREEFRTRFQSVRGLWTIEKIDNVRIHQTADPEIVIAEFTIHRTVSATKQSFASDYVLVMTIRDGLITHSRDYADPVASARAFGRLDELVAAYR
jgi:ketosteroid isomerase-like protein